MTTSWIHFVSINTHLRTEAVLLRTSPGLVYEAGLVNSSYIPIEGLKCLHRYPIYRLQRSWQHRACVIIVPDEDMTIGYYIGYRLSVIIIKRRDSHPNEKLSDARELMSVLTNQIII